MNVQVVSLNHKGFHDKLHQKTCESIEGAGHKLTFEAFSTDLLHFTRVSDLKSFSKMDFKGHKVSFLMMGISNLVRFPEELAIFKKFLGSKQIHRIIIMSIHPASCEAKLRELVGHTPDKVVVTDEPPFETREFYRSESKWHARVKQQISQRSKVCLYFGTYFYSKGADLLLEQVDKYPDWLFYMVGDTSITSFDYSIRDRYKSPNIVWVDSYVSEIKARDYFRACDVVALPYRKFYEHDTSGVFNQAMLAEIPVWCPDFDPFKSIIKEFAVGGCGSLGFVYNETPFCDGFDKYLDNQRGWEVLGESL